MYGASAYTQKTCGTASSASSSSSPARRRDRVVGRAFSFKSERIEIETDPETRRTDLVRRALLSSLGLGALPALLEMRSVRSVAWAEGGEATATADGTAELASARARQGIDYRVAGPLQVLRLPRLKHIYTSCSTPADRCTLKISAWVPQGGSSVGLKGPFPLAVITSGFLIGSDQYNSYAERLASWGYVVVSYDFSQQVLDPTTDIECVKMLLELIDWISTSGNPLSKVSDTENVMLIGHSRGGKISTLAAINDTRVKSLFLIDPVDVTVYTPDDRISYPSATVALSAAMTSKASKELPVCVVGAGRGGDCAPVESSFDLFYKAARGPAWKAVVEEAGHLQFLDQRAATAMGAFCQAGTSPDDDIKDVTRLMMVAWAETSVRRRDGSRIAMEASGALGVARSSGGDGGDDDRTRANEVIDGVYAAVKESPIPTMFEYKNF